MEWFHAAGDVLSRLGPLRQAAVIIAVFTVAVLAFSSRIGSHTERRVRAVIDEEQRLRDLSPLFPGYIRPMTMRIYATAMQITNGHALDWLLSTAPCVEATLRQFLVGLRDHQLIDKWRPTREDLAPILARFRATPGLCISAEWFKELHGSRVCLSEYVYHAALPLLDVNSHCAEGVTGLSMAICRCGHYHSGESMADLAARATIETLNSGATLMRAHHAGNLPFLRAVIARDVGLEVDVGPPWWEEPDQDERSVLLRMKTVAQRVYKRGVQSAIERYTPFPPELAALLYTHSVHNPCIF